MNLRAKPPREGLQLGIVVGLSCRTLQSLRTFLGLHLDNLIVARWEPLILQIDLPGIFETANGVLDTLGTQHKSTGRKTATGDSLEFCDALGLLSENLEDTRETTNGENLVLDRTSLELDRLGVLVSRRRKGRGGRTGRSCRGVLPEFLLGAGAENGDEHVGNLLADEGKRPGENVHEVREPVGVRRAVELANVHNVVLVLQHGGLVVVNVEVVGRGENGHNTRESGRPGLAVHAVTSILGLVGADDGEEVILLQEVASS